MGKTITKSAPYTNELDVVFTRRHGRALKVSAAEMNGIRNILANPAPPTPEMQMAWADYIRYAAENSESNW